MPWRPQTEHHLRHKRAKQTQMLLADVWQLPLHSQKNQNHTYVWMKAEISPLGLSQDTFLHLIKEANVSENRTF